MTLFIRYYLFACACLAINTVSGSYTPTLLLKSASATMTTSLTFPMILLSNGSNLTILSPVSLAIPTTVHVRPIVPPLDYDNEVFPLCIACS